MNTASVKWVEELTFSANTGSGHQLTLGAGSKEGEPSAGPSPMELLLLGLAGCTGIDIVHILQRQRQPLQGLKINVSGQRAEENPKVYTQINVEYIVSGDVDEFKLQRAIQLSEEKYCSASAMLDKVATIETSYRLE
ncbi:MAG: OsmC family protein [Chloroflexi bacterium]|nr:OsmC family protein [Chloroflexota bacterium]